MPNLWSSEGLLGSLLNCLGIIIGNQNFAWVLDQDQDLVQLEFLYFWCLFHNLAL